MWGLHTFTLFEGIDKTRQLGLSYVGGLSFQKVSREIPKNFDCNLTDDELRQVRLKMDDAGVRMPTCFHAKIPGDEAGCRKVFEFGRKLGYRDVHLRTAPGIAGPDRTFLRPVRHQAGHPQPRAEAVARLLAHPEGILEVCKGRGKRIGACPDTGYWIRSGIDPIEGIRKLGDRLITIQPHDLDELTPAGHDVPWGSGKAEFAKMLAEIRRLGIRPTLFGLEYSYKFENNLPEMAQCVEFFNRTAIATSR